MVSFRGQKRLGHPQIDLLQGFNSKFPTSISAPFVRESPPGGIDPSNNIAKVLILATHLRLVLIVLRAILV